jgi:hypothetical protein
VEKMGLEEIGREMRILKDHKVCTISGSLIPSACACARAFPHQHKCWAGMFHQAFIPGARRCLHAQKQRQPRPEVQALPLETHRTKGVGFLDPRDGQ